ncbi:hypothetical protein MACH17_01610 [Phaeobacter inhibens]|uniref:hypothetical protein n=1 Tax=Phaeobacter inhibens TaxID=221822 RepID=UPI0027514F07|nr:hypothetical protein [Phaeobacter inhibens]GLO68644.1 hypothetical protein MACH17_01610 [Phaeobacter inhibens]
MGKGGGDSSAQYRQDEQARQAAIRDGTAKIDETFAQFDDDFYTKQREAFLDFARPQLEDQRADASRELVYSLASWRGPRARKRRPSCQSCTI